MTRWTRRRRRRWRVSGQTDRADSARTRACNAHATLHGVRCSITTGCLCASGYLTCADERLSPSLQRAQASSRSGGEGGVVLSPSAHDRFSLPALHALQASNYRELLTHTEGIPECRGANDHSALRRLCSQPTLQNRIRISAAFTECHLAHNSHMRVQSCQDSGGSSLSSCVKDMNRDPAVLNVYTQFTHAVDAICGDVDRDWTKRRSHEAIDTVLRATQGTAEAMESMQKHTYSLINDLTRDVAHGSSTLLDELLRHTDTEKTRFETLSSQTSKIENNQQTILERLTNQTRHLRSLLTDAEGIQRLINATSSSIVSTQDDILALQRDSSVVVDETHTELLALKQSQHAGFERALESLHTMKTLQDELVLAQKKGAAAVELLSQAQERAFDAAAERLSALAAAQAKSFQHSHEQLDSVSTLQGQIAEEQGSILGHVKSSGEELRRLSAAQAESFAAAGQSLSSIREQAAEAEAKLGAMLGDVRRVAHQLLSVNVDMLAQLFKIESVLFYVAFVPLAYMVTATERTHAARFWIFLALIGALLVELNHVFIAKQLHYHPSQPRVDSLRSMLRGALSIISLLLLLLSALLHRDYAQLGHMLAVKKAPMHDNTHRMLHELLRRTDPSSPRAAIALAAFQPNSFQSRPPPVHADADSDDDGPQIEGQRALSPRKQQRLSSNIPPPLDSQPWQHLDVDSCCPDHRPKPSVFRRIFTSATCSSAASPTAAAAAAAASTTGCTHSTGETGAQFEEFDSTSRHARSASTVNRTLGQASKRAEPQSQPQRLAMAAAAKPQPSPLRSLPRAPVPSHVRAPSMSTTSTASSAISSPRSILPDRNSRASSRSPSPSPSRSRSPSPGISRRTRSHSRSRSTPQRDDERVLAARKAATPARKSAGPVAVVREEREGEDTDCEPESEAETQPGR